MRPSAGLLFGELAKMTPPRQIDFLTGHQLADPRGSTRIFDRRPVKAKMKLKTNQATNQERSAEQCPISTQPRED